MKTLKDAFGGRAKDKPGEREGRRAPGRNLLYRSEDEDEARLAFVAGKAAKGGEADSGDAGDEGTSRPKPFSPPEPPRKPEDPWPESPVSRRFRHAIHVRESQKDDYKEKNPGRAWGRYQMTKIGLKDAGMMDKDGNERLNGRCAVLR